MIHNRNITQVMSNASTFVIETSDNPGDNYVGMTLGAQIKAEREKRNWSQADLARRIGISQPAIKKIEDGKTVKSKFIHEICALLGVAHEIANQAPLAPNTLRAEPDFFDRRNKMKVYASAEGGEGELIVDTDPIDYVDRPYTLADVEKAYAIVVTGESMVPAFKPGDRAWVNPEVAPKGGDDCVVYSKHHELGEMRVLIKEFIKATPTHWLLRQHNPAKDLKLAKAEWQRCYKVVGKFNRE